MARLFETWKLKSHGRNGNSNYWVMSSFCSRMHGAMIDGTPIKHMGIVSWQIFWHSALGRQVRRLIYLIAWCATWCALSPGSLPDARSAAKSLSFLKNLKHSHRTKIKLIVQSSITLLKINMHPLLFGYCYYY